MCSHFRSSLHKLRNMHLATVNYCLSQNRLLRLASTFLPLLFCGKSNLIFISANAFMSLVQFIPPIHFFSKQTGNFIVGSFYEHVGEQIIRFQLSCSFDRLSDKIQKKDRNSICQRSSPYFVKVFRKKIHVVNI